MWRGILRLKSRKCTAEGLGSVPSFSVLHWPSALSASCAQAGVANACMQRRNPLALAHFANHPPAGQQPNVMVASFEADITHGRTSDLQCNGTDADLKLFL